MKPDDVSSEDIDNKLIGELSASLKSMDRPPEWLKAETRQLCPITTHG